MIVLMNVNEKSMKPRLILCLCFKVVNSAKLDWGCWHDVSLLLAVKSLSVRSRLLWSVSFNQWRMFFACVYNPIEELRKYHYCPRRTNIFDCTVSIRQLLGTERLTVQRNNIFLQHALLLYTPKVLMDASDYKELI